MPPRTRPHRGAPASEPANKTYQHGPPPPQQKLFPPRQKVVKTYGNSRVKAAARSLKQQTMTQMTFLVPTQPDELGDAKPENHQELEHSISYTSGSSRPNKRRKTMGDVPSSSRFSTQTLTQVLRPEADEEEQQLITLSDDSEEDMLSAQGSDDPEPPIEPEENRDSKELSTVPQTPQNAVRFKTNMLTLSPSVRMIIRQSSPVGPRRSPLKDKSANSANSAIRLSSYAESGNRKRAFSRAETIPDSYSSAAMTSTPPLAPSSSKRRSPLKEIHPPPLEPPQPPSNTQRTRAALATTDSASSTPRPSGMSRISRANNDEIPDSDDELLSTQSTPHGDENARPVPETPIRPSLNLPPRSQNTETAFLVEDDDLESPTPRRGLFRTAEATAQDAIPNPSNDPSRRNELTRSVAEIEDSDSEIESPIRPSQKVLKSGPPRADILGTSPAEAPDTAHGRVSGAFMAGISSDIASSAAQRRNVHPAEIPTSEGPESESPVSSPEPGSLASPCARLSPSLPQGSAAVESSPAQITPRRSPIKIQARATQRQTQFHTAAYTQMMESQRVSMDILRQMAPQTARSDILVTLHPARAQEIVDGIRNHEFRTVKLPRSVHRLWIYVARPVCELRYMATIGDPRAPGEIDTSTGLGNREFNEGKMNAKWAYELEQVYVLNDPVSLDRMKANGWTENNASQRNKYLQPAVVGQLLSNLQCALFDEGSREPATISQQVEAQIYSDIAQSTRVRAPQIPTEQDEVVESSQKELPFPPQPEKGPDGTESTPKRQRNGRLPRVPSSNAKSPYRQRLKKGGPSQWPTTTRVTRSKSNAEFSQATTASQPSTQVLETQQRSPDKPSPALIRSSSSILPSSAYEEEKGSRGSLDSRGYVMASSQVFIPESLLYDDVRQPPMILDSEDENERFDD